MSAEIRPWASRVLDGTQPNGAFARDAEIADLRAELDSTRGRLTEASAAADELRGQVMAGAKMIAERDQHIAKLKAEISKMKNNLHK